MKDKVFYERTTERHHQAAVENLAQSLHRSRENVNTLYGIVLRHYKKTARINYFLSALVTKRVKELLKDNTMPSDIEGRRSHSEEL
jgi:hypothetical protein